MKAIAVTCPHCGARLRVAEASDTITCEYCNTSSRLQRRTRMLERVMPPPPAMPGRPMPIAVQRRTGLVLAIGLLLPVLMIGAIIGGIMCVTHKISSGIQTRTQIEQPTWQGTEGMLIADVNGDGTLDFIGRTRRLGGLDEIRIAALDGKTGAAIWETDRLGNYNETYTGSLALAGDLVMFTTTRAVIRAFAIKDGKQRWLAKLPERVTRYCAPLAEGADPKTITIVTADTITRLVDRATGAVTAAPPVPEEPPPSPRDKRPRPRKQARPACPSLPTDQRESSDRPDYELGRKNGIQADALAIGPGGRVLGGTRTTGTHVAMLVALDDTDKARWRVDVPQDPLASMERAPTHVVVGKTEVCAAYYTDSVAKPPHVACFALADGKRLWDGEIGKSPLSALAIAGTTIVISQWGTLDARDSLTGTARWRYGR